MNQCLFCVVFVRLGFVISSVCYIQTLFVQGLLCLGFVMFSLLCLGFIMSSVCCVKGLLCLGFAMSRVCYVQGLSCLGFVMSRVCRVQGLYVQSLLCLGFVMSIVGLCRVCLSRVGYGISLMTQYKHMSISLSVFMSYCKGISVISGPISNYRLLFNDKLLFTIFLQ